MVTEILSSFVRDHKSVSREVHIRQYNKLWIELIQTKHDRSRPDSSSLIKKYRIIKIQMRSYSEILQVIIIRAQRIIRQTIPWSPGYWSLLSLKGSYLSMFIFFVCSCWMLWQWDRYHYFFEEKNQNDCGHSRPAFIKCRLSLLFEVSQKYTMWFSKFNSQIFKKFKFTFHWAPKGKKKRLAFWKFLL